MEFNRNRVARIQREFKADLINTQIEQIKLPLLVKYCTSDMISDNVPNIGSMKFYHGRRQGFVCLELNVVFHKYHIRL